MGKKLNMSILKSYKIKTEIEALEAQRKELNKSMIDEMKRTHLTSVEYKNLKSTLVTRSNIEFDKFKLEEKLPKKTYNKIIDKEYKIDDVKEFKAILKQYGVPLKEIRKSLLVVENINQEKIDQLTESKEITKKMLKGTYKLNVSEYIKLKEN